MSDIYKEMFGEEVKKELSELGIYNERREKAFSDGDAYDHVADILNDTYDQFVGQYKTLHKKIHEAVDKRVDQLAEHYEAEASKLNAKIKNFDGPAIGEDEKEGLREKLQDLEAMKSSKIDDMLVDMLDTKIGEMSFVEYVLLKQKPMQVPEASKGTGKK